MFWSIYFSADIKSFLGEKQKTSLQAEGIAKKIDNPKLGKYRFQHYMGLFT